MLQKSTASPFFGFTDIPLTVFPPQLRSPEPAWELNSKKFKHIYYATKLQEDINTCLGKDGKKINNLIAERFNLKVNYLQTDGIGWLPSCTVSFIDHWKKEYNKNTRRVLVEKLISNRTIVKELQEIGERKQISGSYPINKAWSIKIFKSSMFHSLPSKVLAFLSLHKHHNTPCGIASQIIRFLCLPNLPFQHAKTSTTLLGITHCIPNKLKTMVHNSLAKLQWRNKWSTDSPSALHIQHQLTKIIFRLLKLSVVK